MSPHPASARVLVALFFLALVVAHGARDAALVLRWRDDFRAGRLSLGAPGRDARNSKLMQEENLLYLPGFREVADGHVLHGDDYLHESKGRRSPTPLVPRLIGGAVLVVTRLETGWAVAVIHLLQAVSYVLLFAVLRTARVPRVPAAAVVTVALLLAQALPLRRLGLVARAVLIERMGDALTIGDHRFVAPILTLPFFLALLIPLFRDPRLSRPATAVAVGALAGINAYVYYANVFVVAVFLPAYLGLLWIVWPEYRRHHVIAAGVAALVIAPLVALTVASRGWLPADYLARAGMSQYGVHLATKNPRAIATFVLLFTVIPIAVVVAAARGSGGAERAGYGLRARVRRVADAVSGTAGGPLVVLAALTFIPSVLPSLLQGVVDMPQPDRIYTRLGATCSVLTLGVLAWFVAAWWVLPRVARGHLRRVEIALTVLVALALSAVVVRQAREGWTSGTAPYEVVAAHAAVVEALRDRTWPCVVASSSVVAAALVVSRTPCDSLGPIILLSTVSEAEAVDRHVAGLVLESRSLDDVLGFFRLRTVPAADEARAICARGGAERERDEWYTDGITATHHLAPCRPAALRAAIVAAYERYATRPGEILARYRVDAVYSPGGALHPGVHGVFRPGALPGLYVR